MHYPEGTSIPKELVQNDADDAGAREVRFCVDARHHPTEGLGAYAELAPFQGGGALLAYSSAPFTDVDVASIQRIGDSLKKAESKGGKTGRFGVGFNSVYHLTDMPAYASGSRLVMFDPQATHLPHVNPANPGKLLDLELVRRQPPLFEPFRAFGFGPFRLPAAAR